jgi:hypothetical protein
MFVPGYLQVLNVLLAAIAAATQIDGACFGQLARRG